jgi:hypothetical protein
MADVDILSQTITYDDSMGNSYPIQNDYINYVYNLIGDRQRSTFVKQLEKEMLNPAHTKAKASIKAKYTTIANKKGISIKNTNNPIGGSVLSKSINKNKTSLLGTQKLIGSIPKFEFNPMSSKKKSYKK